VRTSASAFEEKAAQFIAGELLALGYHVEIQEFPVVLPPGRGHALTVSSKPASPIETYAMDGAAEGDAVGRLVSVGLGHVSDMSVAGLKGAIAIARRGEVPFGEKAQNVASAGAVALVIYNDEPGLFRGDLGVTSSIPVVSVSLRDGLALLALIDAGPVEATVSLHTQRLTSRNVVATLGPAGAPTVVLGAHYDTVPASTGANDNASGTAVLLTLARELAGREWPFQLQLVAFGSEEIGLLGSRHYVSTLALAGQDGVRAMLNFDALGDGRLTAIGEGPLTALALELAATAGIALEKATEPPGASSDHASFRAVGIPAVFFAGSDFSRIHTADDVTAHIDPQLLAAAAYIGLIVLDRLSADASLP
jgi:Zn-dependent M28 family amino/carboxypeptidase